MSKLLTMTGAIVLLLAACAPSGPSVRPGLSDDAQIAAIEQLMADGEFERAAHAYMQLAGNRPQQADVLYIRVAEAWLAAQSPERAEETLDLVDADQLSFNDRLRLDLAQAELAMQRGNLANAGWLLANSSDRLPDHLVVRHRELEMRLADLQAQPVREALAALEEAIEEPDFHPETALALLLEFPLAELEGLLYEVGDRIELLPWIDMVVSAREVLLDDDALNEALEDWQARWPRIGYSADEARLWIAAWRQSRPLPDQITVVLPSKASPLHRPGEALREGLMAAWLGLAPSRRPELTFRYAGTEPEAIFPAWYDAREQGAQFLVGPLDRQQVDQLLSLPDAGVIPTLLLNLPDDRERLYQSEGEIAAIALPPEEEAEWAAIHALALGHQRAVVLAQRSSWGDRVAESFVDTFTLGGGQVVAHRSYDPDSTDHSDLLRDTLEIDRSEARIARLTRVLGTNLESVEQRRTDIDVIFLAARGRDGRQLRPQLNFFDAGDVPLLATSYIVDGAPTPERDRDLDDVITPMPPWFLDFTPAGATRVRAQALYAELDNPTLSRLHALGRDAIALVPWLQMMRADPELYYPGMSGRLKLTDGHIVQRELPVVQIRGGHARPPE